MEKLYEKIVTEVALLLKDRYSKLMKPFNISNLIKKYGPGYIAKNSKTGRVVAHAKRLDTLFKKSGDRKDIVISWVPKSGARYVL